jgi:hypothetical protein
MTMTVEGIAQVCHAANRALQQLQGDPTIPVSPKWDKLDDETKASAVEGVRNIITGKVQTPEQSHVEWCNFKRAHGWVLGPVKDEAKKEHPLLIPYEQLPEDQRVKDSLFFAVVRALGGNINIGSLINEDRTNASFREGAGEGQ